MKAMIKGFELSVSVSATIKGSFDVHTEHQNYREGNPDRVRKESIKVEDCDLGVEAGLKLAADEVEGEVDLGELSEFIKSTLSDEIAKQVEDQLSKKKENTEEKKEEKEC